jgi:hypothetical protein
MIENYESRVGNWRKKDLDPTLDIVIVIFDY